MTKILSSVAELDREIAALAGLPFGEWAARRWSFRFDEDTGRLPADPFSPEYRQVQLDLYKKITQKDHYDAWTSEPIPLLFEQNIDPYPYPYITRDAEHVGNYFIATGHILHAVKAAKPSGSVLHYGCGTGFTTLPIAAWAMTSPRSTSMLMRYGSSMPWRLPASCRS
jgi:hypothetical protein